MKLRTTTHGELDFVHLNKSGIPALRLLSWHCPEMRMLGWTGDGWIHIPLKNVIFGTIEEVNDKAQLSKLGGWDANGSGVP